MLKTSDELISAVERVRDDRSVRAGSDHRQRLGQIMTPPRVAQLIASLPSAQPNEITLLDPGAGLGSLTAAFVAYQASLPVPPHSIAVTAVEVDHDLTTGLERTLSLCGDFAASRGVRFHAEVIVGDFLTSALGTTTGQLRPGQCFSCILMNPPYGKLRDAAAARRLLLGSGIRVPNWYAAFVAVALPLLAQHGELVAITPRSFCNGPYFKSFRQAVLKTAALRRVHVFDSRSAAFERDDVLQENVIFHLQRGVRQPPSVLLSASSTPEAPITTRAVAYRRIVRPDDPEVFIRLPLDRLGDQAGARMHRFTSSLDDLGLSVSTGPVVDFRVRAALHKESVPGTVPLIYPAHFSGGRIAWPKDSTRKHNAVEATQATQRLLVPNDVYVLVRRFSAKEERRRVVSAVYEPVAAVPQLGIENHLNYYHLAGRGLDLPLAWGLAMYLSSDVVDRYVRLFSGHTQVNATDLRNLPYPSLAELRGLGSGLRSLPPQEEVDRRVARLGKIAA